MDNTHAILSQESEGLLRAEPGGGGKLSAQPTLVSVLRCVGTRGKLQTDAEPVVLSGQGHGWLC